MTRAAAAPAPSAGLLFFNTGTGLAGCAGCGWGGVPSYLDGQRSDECPACEVTYPPPPRSGPKVGRNDPCPCGSGRKHKKVLRRLT